MILSSSFWYLLFVRINRYRQFFQFLLIDLRLGVLFFFACLVVIQTGCAGSFKQKELEKHYFGLEVRRSQVSPAAWNMSTQAGILHVGKVSISPAFASRELVYRTGERTWLLDYYNRFFVTPDNLLVQNIRRWIEESGIFSHVTEASSVLRFDYRLESSVEAFYGDFSRLDKATAVVDIRFFLLKDVDGELIVALDKAYRQEISLSERSATALVQGLDAGLAAIFVELEIDLARCCGLRGGR
ncbi:hypothetical protein DSUL_50041 [Desulfovibrionales bacterium]